MRFCPRCGNPVKKNEKFCVKCGFPLKGQDDKDTSSQNNKDVLQNRQQQRSGDYHKDWQQANQTLDKAKTYSTGYFHWLFRTIKHPTAVESGVHPYYGITSITIGVLLMLLSFYNIINNISSIFDNIITKYGSDDPDAISGFVNKFKGGSIKDAVLLCLVSFIVYWLAGFLGRKFTSKHNVNAFQYSNQLATFTNTALICEVVVFIFTLLGAYILALYVSLLTFVIYNVGLIYSIVRKSHVTGRLYVSVIASCCTPIAFVLIIKYLIHSFIMNSVF